MARTHLNRLGRFSSPDPIAGDLGNPQSLNRYSDTLNDSINFIDPLGLFIEPVGFCPAEFHECIATSNGFIGISGTQGRVCHFIPPHEPKDDPAAYDCDDSIVIELPRRRTTIGPAPPPSPPCRIVDPFLGSLELTFKVGLEATFSKLKAGFSLYKNSSTQETGGEANLDFGILGATIDRKTPLGGSLGGSAAPAQMSLSVGPLERNLSTGKTSLTPLKFLRVGVVLGVGAELSFNQDKFKQIAAANDKCRQQGSR